MSMSIGTAILLLFVGAIFLWMGIGAFKGYLYLKNSERVEGILVAFDKQGVPVYEIEHGGKTERYKDLDLPKKHKELKEGEAYTFVWALNHTSNTGVVIHSVSEQWERLRLSFLLFPLGIFCLASSIYGIISHVT